MNLFSVSENGALRKVSKVDFLQTKVFLVDDYKTIYLWFGLRSSSKKKDQSIRKAKILNKKRDNSAIIQMLKQNQEYGSFLAIMDILRKGLSDKEPLTRRTELEIEIDDTMELMDLGLEMDLEAEITLVSHDISQEKQSYEDLCRKLAEIQLSILKVKGKPTQQEIKKKTEDIFKSSSTYEELCWLIAELSTLKEKKSFD